MTKSIRLRRVDYQKLLARDVEARAGLWDQFQQYGFAMLTNIPDQVRSNMDIFHDLIKPYFTDLWSDVLKWPRRHSGQYGAMDCGEETHRGKVPEKKYRLSVGSNGEGFEGDAHIRDRISTLFGDFFNIGLTVAKAHEELLGKPSGYLSNQLSKSPESFTVMWVVYYPKGGFAKEHRDTGGYAVVPYMPGIQIAPYQTSKFVYNELSGVKEPRDQDYVTIEGGEPGDIVVNIGKLCVKYHKLPEERATWHRVVVPENKDRLISIVFLHTNDEVTFPGTGQNIKEWAQSEFSRQAYARDVN